MAEFDIFNLSVSDVETHEAKSTRTDVLYKPSADQGKDGTYKALVRFVPNPENPRNSLVKKYVHWLTDASGNGRLVDSPSSVGESCPIAEVFFKLRNSDSAVDRKMSEKLKRREQYYSLIKVIKDPQNPELEGTYLIYKFGYKIKEKIDAELKPNFGEPTQVFDLFAGKNFELVITRQGEYNNYDTAKFSSSNSAIDLSGTPAERSKEGMAAIKEELDAAPSLEPYQYKAWDGDARDFVNGILRQYLNPGDSLDSVVSKPSVKSVPKKTAEPVATHTATPIAEKNATAANVDSEGDLDSFLNDLDL
tara:strand:- start:21531 stop:22448 length:918 start_codon:yes stop_codon:yes gene_type:complete